MTKHSFWGGVLAAASLALAGGCGDSLPAGAAPDDGAARIEVALTSAPVDALCLRFTVTVGTTVVTRTVDVARTRTAFPLDGLPIGSATVKGEAFSTACASVTATSTATWVSNTVTVTLAAGTTATAALAFTRGGSVAVSADFGTTASSVKQVAVGAFHTCALLRDGTVRCWGRNDQGQLGDQTTTSRSRPVLAGQFGIVELAAGASYTCGVLTDRTVVCWGGQEGVGALGNGVLSGNSVSPVPVTGLGGVTHIAAGSTHTCALLTNGQVRCWGEGFDGQLGNNSNGNGSSPVSAVVNLPRAVQVVAGPIESGALAADGTPYRWGFGVGNLAIPAGGLYAVRMAVSQNAAECSVFLDGSIQCVNVTAPTLANVVDISMGPGVQFALLSNGTVQAWGVNGVGQLGNGTTGAAQTTPVAVAGLTNVVQVAASSSGSHACAVLVTGQVRCWGNNSDGQLGNGVAGGSSGTPVAPGF